MAYNPQNPNGQATSANSAPVVIASDQSTLPVSLSGNQAVNLTQVNGNATTTVASGTQAVGLSDGTNTANVVAGDSGYNGVLTGVATKTINFTSSGTGGQTLLANTNVEGYVWLELVYTSVGSGLTIAGQFSPSSGGTYVANASWNTALGGLGGTVGTVYMTAIHGNYFQLVISALTSGTAAGSIILRSVAPSFYQTSSTVASATLTGSAVPTTAYYIAGINASGNLNGINVVASTADALSNANSMNTNANLGVYNGSTWDRGRSANTAATTTGTGLLGVGNLIFDGTNWQKQTSTTALGTVGTTSGAVTVGQQTVSTSAVQISSSSNVATNGIIVQALSTNSASIFVGGSGVTTSNGFELQQGQAISFTANLNTLYIISAASTTDKICYNAV